MSKAAQEFLQFVNSSPSPFHAVDTAKKMLESIGFQELKESSSWSHISKGKGYYVTRNASALIAFSVGGKFKHGNGFAIIGAHTDSPCLKVKPKSKKERVGYDLVGVETYGGGLWNTWFDRDLSIAGKVLVKSNQGSISTHLVNLKTPILRIPTLAIHLDRSVSSDGFKFNNEVQLTPILCNSIEKSLNSNEEKSSNTHHPLLLELLSKELNVPVENLGEFELCLYDTQSAVIGGAREEYIFSARLDNLLMSFCSIKALIESNDSIENEQLIRVVGLFDNEEVGSNTAHGADSNFLESTLQRISRLQDTVHGNEDAFERNISNSCLVSADMAHAIHPNYSEKHEDNHRPLMNKGVVIKENANQRYATTSLSTTILREIATLSGSKLQDFVVRNDSPCGSTIGPMLSAKLGIKTIDVGNPQLSMHSIREQCGSEDVASAIQLFKGFYTQFYNVNSKLQ